MRSVLERSLQIANCKFQICRLHFAICNSLFWNDRLLSLVRSALRSASGHLLRAGLPRPAGRLSSPARLRRSGMLSSPDWLSRDCSWLPRARRLPAQLLAMAATRRQRLLRVVQIGTLQITIKPEARSASKGQPCQRFGLLRLISAILKGAAHAVSELVSALITELPKIAGQRQCPLDQVQQGETSHATMDF